MPSTPARSLDIQEVLKVQLYRSFRNHHMTGCTLHCFVADDSLSCPCTGRVLVEPEHLLVLYVPHDEFVQASCDTMRLCGMPWGPGSLVLGQNQECYGACFSPEQALDGDIAALRIWSRVLPQVAHADVCLSPQVLMAPGPVAVHGIIGVTCVLRSRPRLSIGQNWSGLTMAWMLQVSMPVELAVARVVLQN